MKNISVEEEWLTQEIKKANKKKTEYLECDRNAAAKKWEAREWLLGSILTLVIDGKRYQMLKNEGKK